MPLLQDLIHRLEVGGGMRYFRISTGVLLLVILIAGYNWRGYHNMYTQEAMDAAQLGRNLAEGKGYTTLFVRPLSIYLVKRSNFQKPGRGLNPDSAELKTQHPDLANPPVYPVLLAGLMKILPFHYKLPAQPAPSFWNVKGFFYRYQPDFLISCFNQLLLLVMTVLVFFIARHMFDASVAWVSAVLILCTELFWRFAVSGLSTILLMLIFVGLVWCLMSLDEASRAQQPVTGRMFGLALLAGACVAAGALTRYAFGWLIIPVLGFLLLFGGRYRIGLALCALVVFGGMMAPWIIRNLHLSGAPFGTASYAILETTFVSPGNRLQRALEPDLRSISMLPFWFKLSTNLRAIVQSDLPKLSGSWISAFFLVGLLIGFRNPTLRNVRYFLLFCLPILVLGQALGHTHLSDDSPEINSENLLVLVAPLVLVYGVGFFFQLLEQANLVAGELRYLAIATFGAVVSLPMILIFLPPRTIPLAYPPYDPPRIQLVADWLKDSELSMSDVPWAVAWYGERQCVWLTLKATPDASDPNTHEDFLAINDYQKPIAALYLTPRTMDARFFSEWIAAGELSWGSFILDCIVRKEVPPTFPLNHMLRAWLNTGQLVLTDRDRWSVRKQAAGPP